MSQSGESHFQREDRDLLVSIDTKLNTLIQSNTDHEIRIRRLELWSAMAIGAIALIQFIGFGYILQHLGGVKL